MTRSLIPDPSVDSGERQSSAEDSEFTDRVDCHLFDVAERSATLRRSAFAWLGLAFAPVLALKLYGVERFFELSGADPFIYTGYTFSTADLIERFGYPYYSVRFGLIIPSNLFAEVLGPVWGYLGLRWLLTVIATGALFSLLRRTYHWQAGALAVAILLLNPTYLRTVMTVYSTSIGVPAMTAALPLLLLEGSRRRTVLYRGAAGILIGLTVNSNPFAVLPVACMFIVWAGLRVIRDRRGATWESCTVVGGAILVTLVGAATYGLRFGDSNILEPSLTAANRLGSGVSPFKDPSLAWLDFLPEIWLAPATSALLLLALFRAERPATSIERCISVTPVAMWFGYSLHEFVLGSYTLETYFYTSYLVGPIVLALATSVTVLLEQGRSSVRATGWLLSFACVLAGPVMWTHLARSLTIWSLNGLLPISACALAAVWLGRRSHWLRYAAVAIACLLPLMVTVASPRNVPLAEGQLPRQQPQYASVYFRYDDFSMSLYQLAADFSASMPRASESPGSLVFWHPSDDYFATLIQWTYLGPYSSIQAPSSLSVMPELDDSTVAQLRDRTPRFLVVLGASAARVDQGTQAVAALSIETVNSRSLSFHRGPYTLYATVIEFEPDSCDRDFEGTDVFWIALPPCAAV